MELIQFIIEIYLGKDLVNRQKMILPFVLAVQQCTDLCKQIYEERNPLRAVFINSAGETLEYKNPAFNKFEGGD